MQPQDAAFILALRRRPEVARYLGATVADEAAQRAFICAQRDRPNDYYYLCRTVGGAPLGTIGLYDFVDGVAEWGRWVLLPGSAAAVGSALLIYHLAFEHLRLREVRCKTAVVNAQVVRFHARCGLHDLGQQTSQQRVGGHIQSLQVQQLEQQRWPQVRKTLTPLAAAAARLLS